MHHFKLSVAIAAVAMLLLAVAYSEGAEQQKKKKTKGVVGTVTEVKTISDSNKGELATLKIKAAPAKKGGATTDQTFTVVKDTKLEKSTAKKAKKVKDGVNTTGALSDIKVGSVLIITPTQAQAKEAGKIVVLGGKKKAKVAQ